SFSEPTASISLISPDNYREFIAPYHKELVDHFKAQRVGVTVHICGTTYPIYEDLIGCGFSTISFDLDQQGDPKLYVDQLARFMEVAKGRAVAIGNVDATKFEKTTKAEMEADVRRCIDTAAKHSGFILSTSCEIPPRSNPELVVLQDPAGADPAPERLTSGTASWRAARRRRRDRHRRRDHRDHPGAHRGRRARARHRRHPRAAGSTR